MFNTLLHVASLIKRGSDDGELPQPMPSFKLPTWGLLMVVGTLLLSIPFLYFVGYTITRIYVTLAIIEDPSAAEYHQVPLDGDDADAEPQDTSIDGVPKPDEEDQTYTPVTSYLRQTLKQIYAIGGFFSYFRGFVPHIVHSGLHAFLTKAIAAVPFVPNSVAAVVAATLLVQISTVWTHVVISQPSAKSWTRRLPPMKKTFRYVALPTAIYYAAQFISVEAMGFLAYLTGLSSLNAGLVQDMTPGQLNVVFWKGFACLVVGLVFALVLAIPSGIVLTRIQASMLPDEDETIIPFGRSFGGKVVPEIVGGTGVLSIKDAWTSLDWAAKVRLAKVYAKVFLVQFLTYIVFTIILAVEFAIAIPSTKQSTGTFA